LAASGIPYVINHLGSMLSVHFSDHAVTDFATAASANNDLFKKYFHAMLGRGVYLPPSAFESWFLNNALSYEDLDYTIKATEESLTEIL
ncbi:MAG TPA: aspartate aminotransferase family protein, partial [Panacibacter sp.]|nr:aspartate aminotransferase family protein [Panacibacter sp.]